MFREKKRKVKLPLRAYLLYFTLLSFLLTGVTFSKYVTQSSGGDSARVVKFGNLQITEDMTTTVENEWIIVPGVPLKKQAVVSTTSASEVATIVFITIDAPAWTFTADYSFKDSAYGKLSWSVNNNWTYLLTEGNKQVYYISLDPVASLEQNILIQNSNGETITVDKALTEQNLSKAFCDSLTVSFKAYMVQNGGFESINDAWNSIKGH